MTSLQQKSLFSKAHYSIEYNGIRIQEQSLNKKAEGLIPFENIPASRFFKRTFRRGAIILCMFAAVLNFFLIIGQLNPSAGYRQPYTAIISFCLIAIPLAILWFSRYEYVGYGLPGSGLIVEANKPSRQAVEAFMAQIHQAKVAYLRELYIDKASELPDEEAIRRLIWLKELGAIDANEFERRRQNLSSTPTSSGLGFHR